MDDIKILCVTHRDFDDSILPAGYQVVKVGKRISDETALSRGWLCDHPGDNIADENPWYSELPAHYWGWKNLPLRSGMSVCATTGVTFLIITKSQQHIRRIFSPRSG